MVQDSEIRVFYLGFNAMNLVSVFSS